MRRSRRTLCLWAGCALLLTGGLVFLRARIIAPSPEKLVAEASRHFAGGQFAKAESLARQALARRPGDRSALVVAADAAMAQNQPEAALEYFLQLPDDCSTSSVSGRFRAGEILIDLGRLSDAEQIFRSTLACDPDHRQAHLRLAHLLGITGRLWESVPHMLVLVRSGRFPAEYLLKLGDIERVVNERRTLSRCRLAAPDDPLPLLGQARVALVENDVSAARRLLEQVVAMRPNEDEAQVQLGRILLEAGSDEEFRQWLARLPGTADRHPDAWVVRGRWCFDQHDLRAAARCFWEAVRRDPNHRQANYRLGSALTALNEPVQAEVFLRRAEKQDELAVVIDLLFRKNHDKTAMSKASVLAESLDRIWEAWGWARLALAEDPGSDWAQQTVARLVPLLRADLPQTRPEAEPARAIDLSPFSLPNWMSLRGLATARPREEASGVQVRFADVAAEAGIEFAYFNGPNPQSRATYIFQSTGGGVAAFDFDGDSWPDLYFTQGCRQPPPVEEQGQHRDCLYRNLSDGRAADVTEKAGLGDERFSQGISAGDYDNDGFADLYVANIGPNRLYQNNGDGTFTDVTLRVGVAGNQWTTSCLIADLNGDSIPDIYDVTYCAGRDIFTRKCPGPSGSPLCPPRAFAAAPDRVYLGLGDGTFQDITESAGIEAVNGYGLGIVAADFEGTGRLNLFVANDGAANFYFINQSDRHDGKLRFTEQALAAGLAFDADGLIRANMGVAAGDADGNGLLDLFVTNFHEESDTLYLQQPGRLFTDMTRQAGLRDASFVPLGFGTQFLDGDLDGLSDLVVTNGHVDDQRGIGQPYEMSPQYYRNVGGGRFVELDAPSLGPFFEGKYLGRGLARLDWNGDGKEDFAISHIGSRAALVVNRTAGAGHFVALEFRGVVSDRDAIGTTVRVGAAGRIRTHQLTAGDGYQASNQRRLVCGLGDATLVETLDVRWPSGLEQTFTDLAADADFVLIEGRSQPVRQP